MKICIFCEKDVAGKEAVPIKEDQIIRTIRKVKKALHIAQMNELYVCKDDVKKHLERRRSFEWTMLIAAILAGGVILLFILAFIFSGRFDLGSFLMLLVIAAFILIFPLPFKYAPALEGIPSPPLFPLKKGEKTERKEAPAAKAEQKKPAKAGRKKK